MADKLKVGWNKKYEESLSRIYAVEPFDHCYMKHFPLQSVYIVYCVNYDRKNKDRNKQILFKDKSKAQAVVDEWEKHGKIRVKS